MNRRVVRIVIIVCFLLIGKSGHADVPSILHVQGRLTDNTGTPLPPGFKQLTFTIFDMETGGTQLWTEPTSLITSNADGLWNTTLGEGTPLSSSVFSDTVRWLEITVNDGVNPAVTLPRVQLQTSPYAFQADHSAHSITTDSAAHADHARFADTAGISLVAAADDDWTVDNTFISTTSQRGILKGASNNFHIGNQGQTIVNLGVACTTGVSPLNEAYQTIGGGEGNRASKDHATVGGGRENVAVEDQATVAGGGFNTASGAQSFVGGGALNTANGFYSAVGAGALNAATNIFATVGGGGYDTASGNSSAVLGGYRNIAAGDSSVVIGGSWNRATGRNATVMGGGQNLAEGEYSLAAGRRAKANHAGSFVWADMQDADFESDTTNEFSIRAANGLRVHADGAEYGATIVNDNGQGLSVNGTLSPFTGQLGALQVHNTGNASAIAATSTNGYAAWLNGNVYVSGMIIGGSSTSKIDHPVDPEHMYLSHARVESPDMKTVYDGTVTLDNNGQAVISLPGYFEALNRDFRYQLTALGAPGPNLYVAERIVNNQFRIAGGAPGMEVSWLVTGIRQDAYANAHPVEVEIHKDAQDVGKYLHATEYAQPTSRAMYPKDGIAAGVEGAPELGGTSSRP